MRHRRARGVVAWAGPGSASLPFLAFSAAFMLIPTIYLVVGSFRDNAGQLTLQNYADLGSDLTRQAYLQSIEISLVTAIGGAILGFLLAFSVISGGLPRIFRGALMTFSGVASNFAGIPLALAFIFTLGRTGLITGLLVSVLGVDIYETGFTLYTKLGIEIVYMYFQFPLMVLIIAPAIDGLRRDWREASDNMGASTLPVLALRGAADPDAIDPWRHDPAVRQCLRRPGDRLPAGPAGQHRAGPDRLASSAATSSTTRASAMPWRWAWSRSWA